MIKLNVVEIKKKLVGEKYFRFELEPKELNLTPDDLPIVGKIMVEGNLANGGDVLLLHAVIKACVARQCGRCLKEFQAATQAEILEKFYPADAHGIEKDAYTYEYDVVDITEALREGLLLVEPISALCKEDCRGLCPVCGIDRNLASCACETDTIDPRLAALKQLLKN
ncbi:MAG: DUF177 domain-containing protein [Acidaminococcaceae bacterium]|nr:DUF177 domain-containing protein [Acidaminococcaceae bacterium]